MRTIPWDPVRLLPVGSVFVVPYLSAFAMPFLLLYALRDITAYRKYALAIACTIAVSGAFFVLLPLTIERPALSGAAPFDPLLSALYAADRPTNLFPSLHISLTCLFASGIAQARPRWKAWVWAWAALIALSTLLTRQHYAVDVAGGALLAWCAWRLFPGSAKPS